MTTEESDRARLVEFIRRRQDELAIDTDAEMIRLSGLAPMTWYRIRDGESVKPQSYRKVDAALEWLRGSSAAILAGGEPTPQGAANHATKAPDNPYTDPAERGIWEATDLSEDERRSWINLLRERRRATG